MLGVLLAIALAAAPATLPPPARTAAPPTVEDVANAIRWLVTPDDSKPYLARTYHGTRAQRDGEWREELARAFLAGAEQFGLPVFLLVAMAYRETVFRTGLVGPAGELGLLQVGEFGRRRSASYCADMGEDAARQVACGAGYLRRLADGCGSLQGGLSAYASGKCNPSAARNPARVLRAVGVRNTIWRWLEEGRFQEPKINRTQIKNNRSNRLTPHGGGIILVE